MQLRLCKPLNLFCKGIINPKKQKTQILYHSNLLELSWIYFEKAAIGFPQNIAKIRRNKNANFFRDIFIGFYKQCSYQKIFIVTQLPRRYIIPKGVTVKSSHKNKQLSVKNFKNYLGRIFRKELFSFIENKLLQSFLVFSDFSRMKSALAYYKLL